MNKRQLIKEGDQLKDYVESLEKDTNRRLEKGAQGRTTKLIALNDKQAKSYDGLINRQDAYIKATERETKAEKARDAVKKRRPRLDATKAKKAKDLAAAERELADAELMRADAAQKHAAAANDQTRAVKNLNDENGAHNKLLREHDVVVKSNRQSLRDYSHSALNAKNQTLSLRDAHVAVIRSSSTLSRSFDAVGASTNKAFREHQQYNRMARDSTVSQEKLRNQLDRTNDAYDGQTRAVSSATSALRRYHNQASAADAARVRREQKQAARRATSGNKSMDFDPGRWAARNLGALTPLGIVTPTLVIPLGLAFTQVANSAVAASQSIALLPASLVAGAAAFGSIKLATMGFSDTIGALMEGDLDKFAELIQKLSPSAQQLALTFKSLGPSFKAMQQSAQEALFTGLPQLIHSMSLSLGPMVEGMTTSIAASMNDMMRGVGHMLMSPDGLQDMETITARIAELFERLRPAIADFSQAFLTLVRGGADFLPIMADDISDVARRFSNFLSEARNSGGLREFMYDGWEALKAVGGAIKEIGGMLYDVFGIHGKEGIEEFRETMSNLTDLLEALFRTLKSFFEDIAFAFSKASDFVGLFGIGLEDTSDTLVLIAEAWLFLHGIKFFMDLKKAVQGVNIALMGTAAASGAAGAAGAGGGALGALGSFGAAVAGLAGPLLAAAAAIGSVAAISMWYYNLSKDWGKDLPPTLPNMPTDLAGNPKMGLTPGNETPGVPRPTLTDSDRASLQYQGIDPSSLSAEDLWRALGKEVPPPVLDAAGRTGLGTSTSDPYYTAPPIKEHFGFGEVPSHLVPPAPFGSRNPDGSIVGVPAGSYELENFGAGQFPGAEWDVPAGIMDIPAGSGAGPAGAGHGGRKPGYFEAADPYDVFKQQSAVNDAKQRMEEQRIALLKAEQEGNRDQEKINKASQGVIKAEQSWIDQVRRLKELERGEFKELEGDFKEFGSGLKDSLGDLGLALDNDLGLSRGLAGLAENAVKFFATLGAAPLLGAMKGQQAALGFPGAEGSGSGLVGIIGSMMGYQNPNAGKRGGQNGQYQQLGPMIPGMTVPGVYGAPPGPGQQPYDYRNGVQGGEYPGDEAILSNVPSGEYISEGGIGDLTKGFGDCTSSLEDLVNLMDGVSTAGRDFSTGDAQRWLSENGFLPNNTGADIPGAMNIGYYDNGAAGGHAQGTMPGGQFFNYGGDASAAAGGRAGGGAHDPNMPFTHQYSRPVNMPQTANIPMPYRPRPTQQMGPPGSFAAGGAIAASDTVPAMLTPGEHVLSVQDVAALGGQSGVYALRNMAQNPVQGFGPGGAVGNLPQQPPPTVPTPPPAPSPSLEMGIPEIPQPGSAAYDPAAAVPPPGTGPDAPGGPGGVGPSLPTVPSGMAPGGAETPLGVPTEGAHVGAEVAPYEGSGPGFSMEGGVTGALTGAASAAAGMAANAAAPGSGAAASAAIDIGIQEMTRAIEFGAQAAGIGVQGLIDTALPAGGSALAQENWLTRFAGGIAGAAPNLANMAGAVSQEELGKGASLPGVGPSTPEQIATQGMAPNRTQHVGNQPTPGPAPQGFAKGGAVASGNQNGVFIQNYSVQQSEDKAGQDLFNRYYPAAGAR